jgi:hypothetical protein
MTPSTPTPTDPTYHTAPLVHLVRHTLHGGKPLAELVRVLRRKRRRKGAASTEAAPTPEGDQP